jgi:hypothetical protein
VGLGLAERLGQPLWRARSGRRGRPAAEHADDLPCQCGVRGALPGMAFKQLRYRVEQEREQQVSWLGEIESALESAFGRLPLTERGTGARLKQEGRDQPHLTGWAWAVEDRRERGGRRPRVVLREPQRRHSGADTRTGAPALPPRANVPPPPVLPARSTSQPGSDRRSRHAAPRSSRAAPPARSPEDRAPPPARTTGSSRPLPITPVR